MKLQKVLENVDIKTISLISFFYTVSFGLILFNDGLFFDDWVVYHLNKSSFILLMKEYGMPWIGWLHSFAPSFYDNIVFNRSLQFFCYLFAAFCLYGVLKTIKEIASKEKLLISLFFALFPVNFSRILFATSHYSISYFLFFLGFFVLSKYFVKRNIFFRISALLLLLLSFFSLQSLPVFYPVIILYIIYAERAAIKDIKGLLSLLLKYIDFLIAPAIFWVMRSTIFNPQGLYEGYNGVHLISLLRAIWYIPITFINSFITPLDQSFQFLRSNPAMISILTLLIARFMYKKYFSTPESKSTYDVWFLLFGIVAFIFGVYGYLVVNKLPASYDAWSSRYQILVPLGASFITVYLVRIFFNGKGRTIACSLLLVLFIYINFTNYLRYQQDWFKQLSLIENFRESEVLKNNASFIFNDKTLDLNANNRIYGFTEYTGLMKYAFGDEKRFGTAHLRKDFFRDLKAVIPQGQYNCREYKMQPLQYEVIIDYGEYRPTNKGIIGLIGLRLIKPGLFKDRIRNLIKLQYVKL